LLSKHFLVFYEEGEGGGEREREKERKKERKKEREREGGQFFERTFLNKTETNVTKHGT